MKLKLVEKSILLALVLTMLLTMTGFTYRCESISDRVFRLHVIANSDSEEDQALKLKVRDKMLEFTEGKFDNLQTRDQAMEIAQNHLDELQSIAQQEVYDEGYDYPVQVEITNMYFNTRVYDTVTLPAGRYDALRVTIGEAKGKNWWCVMFPPMCLPAAEESKELGDVLDDSQMDVVQGGQKYEVKFKVVEWFEEIKNWFTSF